MLAAGCAVATAAVGSATQGAYDNAYIPAIYFGALFAAVSAVELPATLSGHPSAGTEVWGSVRARRPHLTRVLTVATLSLLAVQILFHWFPSRPHRPSWKQTARARRFIAVLRTLGPKVFVPYHPYYNVMAGGQGHTHIMGVNDAMAWAKRITGDPARDRKIKAAFRRSIYQSFRKGRWSAVIHDRTWTHQLPGLRFNYVRDRDLLRQDAAPRMLTGNPCAPRFIWVPVHRDR